MNRNLHQPNMTGMTQTGTQPAGHLGQHTQQPGMMGQQTATSMQHQRFTSAGTTAMGQTGPHSTYGTQQTGK